MGLYVNDLDLEMRESLLIPILSEIETLRDLKPGSDEFGSLLTQMVREKNKVADTLKESTRILDLTVKEVERLHASYQTDPNLQGQ